MQKHQLINILIKQLIYIIITMINNKINYYQIFLYLI